WRGSGGRGTGEEGAGADPTASSGDRAYRITPSHSVIDRCGPFTNSFGSARIGVATLSCAGRLAASGRRHLRGRTIPMQTPGKPSVSACPSTTRRGALLVAFGVSWGE